MFAQGAQRGMAMLAAINLASRAQGGQQPASQPAAAPSGDWIQYANQGSIRNDPLSPDLISAMSFLPEMGIRMRVTSGGQENNTTSGTGSVRHNHGNAGDVEFITADGTVLDGTNPQHRPIIADIVQRARANGVNGWGWGTDYMGATRFHMGFGNPAVWGAGGRSANVDPWFAAAYNAGTGGPSPTLTGSSGNTLTGGSGSTALTGSAGSDVLGTNALAAPGMGQQPGGMDMNALALLMASQQPQMPEMANNTLDANAFMAPVQQNALLPITWGR